MLALHQQNGLTVMDQDFCSRLNKWGNLMHKDLVGPWELEARHKLNCSILPSMARREQKFNRQYSVVRCY
jgi:hypothetical protein